MEVQDPGLPNHLERTRSSPDVAKAIANSLVPPGTQTKESPGTLTFGGGHFFGNKALPIIMKQVEKYNDWNLIN